MNLTIRVNHQVAMGAGVISMPCGDGQAGTMHARITKSNAWDPSLLEYYPNWSRNDFLRLIKKMDGSEWL